MIILKHSSFIEFVDTPSVVAGGFEMVCIHCLCQTSCSAIEVSCISTRLALWGRCTKYQIFQKLGEFGVTRLRLWTSPIPRVCILNYKKSVYASLILAGVESLKN
jgi:hypothetical protein